MDTTNINILIDDENKNIINGERYSLDPLVVKYNETNDEKYLLEIINRLKSRKCSIDGKSIKDCNFLLFSDSSGKCIIDYILENDVELGFLFKYISTKDINLVRKYIEHNKYDFSDASEYLLFSKYDGDKTLIEYLFEHEEFEKVLSTVVGNVHNNYEVIDLIIKHYRINLLADLSESMLFAEFAGKTVIEYLFEHNMIDKRTIENIHEHAEIIDLVRKYNREDLIQYFTMRVCIHKHLNEDRYILEDLIDMGININGMLFFNEIIKIIIKINRYDLLVNCSEIRLLSVVNPPKTILEELLEKGYQPSVFGYYKEESAKVFLKLNRYDLLTKCSMEVLLKNADINETYLDLILNEFDKNPESIKLSKINSYSQDNALLAKFLMIFSKHNLIEYIGKPSASTLMNVDKNGKRLIDELLVLDKEETLKKILPNGGIKDADLFIYLRLIGIDVKNRVFSNNDVKNSFIGDILEDMNISCDSLSISADYEILLNELKILMLKDGRSDPKLVETMIRSYRRMIASGNVYGIKELIKIINIKKSIPNFSIIRTDGGSSFTPTTKSINLNNEEISAINHEMGHALYSLVTNEEYPSEYEQLVKNIRNNPDFLDKVNEISKKYYDTREKLSKIVEEKYGDAYKKSITSERRKEIEDFIAKNKKEKIEEYSKLGYSKDEIEAMMFDEFTYDKYVEQDWYVKKNEIINILLDEDYPGLSAIGDILDAIYEGKFFSSKLTTTSGVKIKGTSGHGIKYYNRGGLKLCFNEILANYSDISKMPRANEAIENLRSVVGDEFISFIKNFYEQKIVNSEKYTKVEEESKVL